MHPYLAYRTGCKTFENGSGVSPDTEEIRPFLQRTCRGDQGKSLSSFFIGLPGYRDEAPFVPSLLVGFRKRLNENVLAEINEMIIEFNKPKDPPPKRGKRSGKPSAPDGDSDSSSKEQPGENWEP